MLMSTIQSSEIQRISSVFKALGNETRVKILLLIYQTERPLHIKAVAEALKVDYAALYRHIKVLQKSGLIDIYEVGRSRVLYVKNKELTEKLIEAAKKIL